MIRFISRRLLLAIPLLLGIVTITFFVIQAAPGDPMDMFLEPRLQRQMDAESLELLRQKYGLDQPVHIQYGRWLGGLLQGDLGESFRYRRPVAALIAERVPYATLRARSPRWHCWSMRCLESRLVFFPQSNATRWPIKW